MAPLRLSIVVPTHNTRELALACLQSLTGGSSLQNEVLVVDDGSADGTAEAVAGRFPEARVLRHDRATGFSAAANRGAAAAGGEVILFLNSDTEVETDALLALISAFEGDAGLGIAGAALRFPDGRPQWSAGPEPSALWLFSLASGLPAHLRRLPGYDVLRRFFGGVPTRGGGSGPVPVDWVTGAALAVRRQVWSDCGPFDESVLFYCQDLDLCTAAREAGWKVGLIPTFRVMHHHGATIAPGASRMFQGERNIGAGQDAERLWSDLVAWTAKRKGQKKARRARWALTWGGRLRLAFRTLARPFVADERHTTFQAETIALRQALTKLSSLA
ncbi:MAG: glycosyltransferase [Acidobacteriota bacterium]